MMKKKYLSKTLIIVFSLVIISGLFVAPLTVLNRPVAAVSTEELQAQANALQAQIDDNNKKANALANQADSLKNKIAEFDIQIAQINAQIELISVKIAQLDNELAKAQAELDRQKELLKASLQALYKKGGASTVELLVGSESFSQFINDQTYLERLKSGIQTSTEKVIALKQQIQQQQEEQKNLLRMQQESKATAESARAERARLLEQTQGEEARYREVSEDLQAQQQKIMEEIVARSRVLANVGTGSYPWAHYREGNWTHADSCFYYDDGDPWGYCYRQCVSYVAWKLYSVGRQPPIGYGNAGDWAWRAPIEKRGYEPRVGAVAVWTGFWEGHVAYVEQIYGNGEIRISEYNAVPAYQGRYSERIISAYDPDIYLYF